MKIKNYNTKKWTKRKEWSLVDVSSRIYLKTEIGQIKLAIEYTSNLQTIVPNIKSKIDQTLTFNLPRVLLNVRKL